jgi:protein-disulfide isomerase
MTSIRFRTLALALVAAPLSLALAACDKGGDAAAPGGEKIAAIAPPAGKTWADTVTKTPEGGYLMGNPDAPIKLLEYGSLTCPHCADFAETSMAELRDKFVASGRVSFEFRNFVRDAIDVTAAQLTRCGAPESYFALTDQAFANQAAMFQKAQGAGEAAYTAAMALPDAQRGQALADLTGLSEFFASRGISRDQAATCLANTAEAQALAKRTQEQGDELNITGTPTFFINGEKLDLNAWPEIKARLETMGAR